MTFQYQVLANQLAHRIYQDELKPHQKLISLRDFARQQGIIVKLLYYSYKIRKKLEITHRLSRSTILYAYV